MFCEWFYLHRLLFEARKSSFLVTLSQFICFVFIYEVRIYESHANSYIRIPINRDAIRRSYFVIMLNL